MNKIYDFSQIERIRKQFFPLIMRYVLFVLCCIVAIAVACAMIENNVLLTLIFALLVLCFLLGSVLFWRIKYRLLKSYMTFLDNMETGKREDYVGKFEEKISSLDDCEQFDIYVFDNSSAKTSFLIHKQHPMSFAKGQKYHLEHIGNYLYQWENID